MVHVYGLMDNAIYIEIVLVSNIKHIKNVNKLVINVQLMVLNVYLLLSAVKLILLEDVIKELMVNVF